MSSKPLFGPPPPAELGSGKLLSQGAEARIWLLNLPPQSAITPSTTLAGNNDTTGGCSHDGSSNFHADRYDTMKNDKITTTSTISTLRKMHVGGGIHVPHILHISQLLKQQEPPPLSSSSSSLSCSSFIIIKERFPKKYRHPSLDSTLTKNRTRGEARALIRCLKAGVSCPNVLGIGYWPSSSSSSSSNINTNKTNPSGTATSSSSSSSCLVLEWIEGCTVRQYLEHRSSTSSSSLLAEEPNTKRPRFNTKDEDGNILKTPMSPPNNNNGQDRITTPIDAQTLRVARSIGQLVGKMHAAGIIHGDLTTSNIMLRNPPWTNISSSSSSSASGNTTIIDDGEDYDNEGAPLLQNWKPQLALIDFGLASSTTTTNNNNTSNNKNTHKQQHNAEEKAVDLYVLERAFLSSHPESERLVEELLDGYRDYYYYFVTSLGGTNDVEDAGVDVANTMTASVIATSSTVTTDGTRSREGSLGNSTQAANMILNRLEQVRMRGRKRECFG